MDDIRVGALTKTFGEVTDVDGLRGALIGVSDRGLLVNLAIMGLVSLFMVMLGAFSFERSESV